MQIRLSSALLRKKNVTIHSFYKSLIMQNANLEDYVSLKAAVLVATAYLRNNLTLEYLGKHRISVIDWCCRCKKGRETIDHFLLHY